jgi:hypothetical protein
MGVLGVLNAHKTAPWRLSNLQLYTGQRPQTPVTVVVPVDTRSVNLQPAGI